MFVSLAKILQGETVCVVVTLAESLVNKAPQVSPNAQFKSQPAIGVNVKKSVYSYVLPAPPLRYGKVIGFG